MKLWQSIRHPLAALDAWWRRVSPERRMDQSPSNFCMLIGLMLPSLAIVLRGPALGSGVADMHPNLQIGMCACIFFGCALKLHGATAGTRFWFPHTSLKQCYRFGFSGAPAAAAGLFVYGYYILANTSNFLSALGGILTPMLGLGIALQAGNYWLEVRRIEQNEHAMIAAAKQTIVDDRSTDR